MNELRFFAQPTLLSKSKVLVTGLSMMKYPDGRSVDKLDASLSENYAMSLVEIMVSRVIKNYELNDNQQGLAWAIGNLYGVAKTKLLAKPEKIIASYNEIVNGSIKEDTIMAANLKSNKVTMTPNSSANVNLTNTKLKDKQKSQSEHQNEQVICESAIIDQEITVPSAE